MGIGAVPTTLRATVPYLLLYHIQYSFIPTFIPAPVFLFRILSLSVLFTMTRHYSTTYGHPCLLLCVGKLIDIEVLVCCVSINRQYEEEFPVPFHTYIHAYIISILFYLSIYIYI